MLKRLLEKVFASRAQTRVVQHFLDRPKEFFNLSRLAKETGLAHSTIHRVMQPLVDMGLVKEIKAGQQIRLFILETEDERSKIISDFYSKIRPYLETSYFAPLCRETAKSEAKHGVPNAEVAKWVAIESLLILIYSFAFLISQSHLLSQ